MQLVNKYATHVTAGGSPGVRSDHMNDHGAFPELVAAAMALLQVATPISVPGTLLEAKPPAYAPCLVPRDRKYLEILTPNYGVK